jgi:DNA-binding winged helix-turn-helix (wHTH) protein/Flp pilus assembly protein TadD
VIRLGPFEIDPRTRMLRRDAQPVDLSPRLVEILAFLAQQNGEIVTKEQLLEKFWPDVNVTENTLTRAIADIRIALGDSASEPKYIQTLARRGYKWIASSTGSQDPKTSGPQDLKTPRPQDLKTSDPFEEWVKGRLALESLEITQLPAAIAAFEAAVAELPSYAPAYAGLANAYLLQFESTRFTNLPDRALLDKAITAARRACSVDPSLGEGWAVLGYLLNAAGQLSESLAAARRATALEPDNWRHQFRLACSTWGEERLRAADRTIDLMPSFAAARMMSATVFVARGALARAEQEAAAGAALQRQGRGGHSPMRAAGLHWLCGLILAARGDPGLALACFDEEAAAAGDGHIYGSEFAANALVAAGFVLFTREDPERAVEMFTRALDQTPTHARATLGLAAARIHRDAGLALDEVLAPVRRVLDELGRGGRRHEAALVRAGELIVRGRVGEAVALLDLLLDQSPPGPAGWIIPVDPMLTAVRFSPARTGILAKLAARAS